MLDTLLTTREAAKFLAVSQNTLSKWRRLGRGPRAVIRGTNEPGPHLPPGFKAFRYGYFLSELEAWVNRAHTRKDGKLTARPVPRTRPGRPVIDGEVLMTNIEARYFLGFTGERSLNRLRRMKRIPYYKFGNHFSDPCYYKRSDLEKWKIRYYAGKEADPLPRLKTAATILPTDTPRLPEAVPPPVLPGWTPIIEPPDDWRPPAEPPPIKNYYVRKTPPKTKPPPVAEPPLKRW